MDMDNGYTRLLTADQARGRVYVEPGWLPADADCPELAGLRDEHERLLAVVGEKLHALNALTRAVRDAEAKRSDAVRDAILAGDDPASIEIEQPSDDEIARARTDYEAAAAALEVWVGRTLARIDETAPQIDAAIAQRLAAAEEKRREALRLIEEAARLAAEPQRLRRWLERYVTVTDAFSNERRKASVLGPIAFDALDLPEKEPVPELIREIAGLAPAQVVDVGSDELDATERAAIRNG